MKNVYLNSVLISRFYLQTIHKTTKIIITKIKKKVKKYKDKERRIIPFNMLKTTIKIIKILTNSCKTKHKRRGEENMK
jgi:hypothetical protein